jgi:hypothetical protein
VLNTGVLTLSTPLADPKTKALIKIVVSKPQSLPAQPDADGAPVTQEVEAELRRRLETLDEDDRREADLSDRFLESVERTLEPISTNANQYQVALLDLHRVPIRPFE